jgi:hypothetical protein
LCYCLRGGLLINVQQYLLNLCMELRILLLKLHKSSSAGTGSLRNSCVEYLLSHLLCLLEQRLHTCGLTVLQT